MSCPIHKASTHRRQSLLLFLIASCSSNLGCMTEPGDPVGQARLRTTGDSQVQCLTIRRGQDGDIADTQIAENQPNKNFGTRPVANIGRSGGGRRQTLLHADLSAIPAGSSIESATLTLWQTNTGQAEVQAHAILAPWDELSVTWQSFAAAYASDIAASADNGGPGHTGPIILDIQPLVSSWVSGQRANHGLLLDQSSNSATRIHTGKVGNLDHRPRLDVCYIEQHVPEGTSLFLQVLDAAGQPIPTAVVTIGDDLRPTDGAGRLLLENLAPGRVVARVDKPGYTSASAVMDLFAGAHAGTEVRLTPLSPPVAFDAQDGATIQQSGARVVIPPGVLVDRHGEPVTGTVEATIVPLDPTTQSLAAMPGPLAGVTETDGQEDGQEVELESLVMAEVSLWQDGQPVHLAPGARAIVELPLPSSVLGELEEGDTIPAWWFDLDAGIWRQEGAGTIVYSPSSPSRHAWAVEVAHFTWWNCDRPWTDKNCYTVTVLDADGNPVPDMNVGAEGISYTGSSRTAVTSGAGDACVDTMLGGTVEIYVGSPDAPLGSEMVIGDFIAGDCAGQGAACTPVTIYLPPDTVVCTPGTFRPCAYPGPAGTEGVGLCQAGINSCNATGTAWSGCVGEVVPAQETCTTPFDDDCDGEANEPDDSADCECAAGDTVACYTGPSETLDVGICQAGVRTCDTLIGRYGACEGQVLPQPENCDTADADDNCDGSLECHGELQWSTAFSGSYVYTSALDQDGNVILGRRNMITKLDSTGQPIWTTQFLPSNGWWNWSYPERIAVDDAGQVTIAGYFRGTVDFGGGPLTASNSYYDMFIVKLDAGGQHVWSRQFSDSAHYSWPRAAGITFDSAGHVLVAGNFRNSVDFGGGPLTCSGSYCKDGYLVELDRDGQHRWSGRLAMGNGRTSISALAVDSADNLVLAGFGSNMMDLQGTPIGSPRSFILGLDPTGAYRWHKALGEAYADVVSVDNADGLVVAGHVFETVDLGGGPLVPTDERELFVLRLDANGQHRWSRSIDGVEERGDCEDEEWADISDLAVDSADAVVITGLYQGTATLGGDTFTSGLGFGIEPCVGYRALRSGFVAKLDSDGMHLWSQGFSTGFDNRSSAYTVAFDTEDYVLLSGWFDGTATFGGQSVTAPGGSSHFLISLEP